MVSYEEEFCKNVVNDTSASDSIIDDVIFHVFDITDIRG